MGELEDDDSISTSNLPNCGSILDLTDIKYNTLEDHNEFYTKFRSLICGHLKKSGDRILLSSVDDDEINSGEEYGELLQDEVLSPTFEEVILLWCLEKIDPELPKHIRQTFGNQLKDEHQPSSLKALQPMIFKIIPAFLDFDHKEDLSEPLLQVHQDQDFPKKRKRKPKAKDNLQVALSLPETTLDCDINESADIKEDLDYTPTDENYDPSYEQETEFRPKKRGPKKKKLTDNSSEGNVCLICGKSFKSEKHLGWHQRYHRIDTSTYTCKVCGKSFSTKMRFYAHKQTHKIEYCDCATCGKTFETRKSLTDHIYKHHRNNIKCKDCESILSNYTEYRAHVKAHESGEIPVKSTHESNDIEQPNNESKNEVLLSNGLDINQDSNTKIEVYKITSILSEEHRSELDEVGNTRETTEMVIEINAAATLPTDPLFLSCVICQKSFNDQWHLDEHKKVHGTELHLCQVCDRTFDSGTLLQEHLKTNHKSTIPCKKCDKVLDNIVEFKAHMKAIHKVSRPKKEYPCELCGKILRSIESLKVHLENHDRDLTCTECGLKFDQKQLYNTHMSKIHQIPPNSVDKKTPCEFCGKLVTQQRLKKHMKTHAIKHRCNTCTRAFPSEEELGSHICRHYSCDICDKKFVQGRNLELHKREHAGEMMYQCNMCEALFDKKKLLGAHRRFMHFKQKRFKCELCSKDFAVKMGLANHMRLHTGERPYKCEECGLTFISNSSLHTHKKIHSNEMPHECQGCHKRFRMAGNLKTHREAKLCGVTENELFRNRISNLFTE